MDKFMKWFFILVLVLFMIWYGYTRYTACMELLNSWAFCAFR